MGASLGPGAGTGEARGSALVGVAQDLGQALGGGHDDGVPAPPARLLRLQHGDDVCDGTGVVLGPGITHRVGTAAPDSGLGRAPKRDSLRHNVRSVYVHQDRVAADEVEDLDLDVSVINEQRA